MNEPVTIGRLLRSSTRGCAVGCLADGKKLPDFGALVRIPAGSDLQIYGLIYDTHVDDDGLVRQLAGSTEIPSEIIEDNRRNRNTPVELSVLFIGYAENAKIRYLLPPQPPFSLESMFSCDAQEIKQFCAQSPTYLRFLLSAQDVPAADVAAAHILQAGKFLPEKWRLDATREWIRLVRDNPTLLSASMSTFADIFSDDERGNQP